MAEKLKSILKRISWYSALKAAVFAAAWWLLPSWIFVLAALYLYYVPVAGALKVSAPFWVLLILTFFETQNLAFAVIFGAVFYLILLIKDLLIIDRRTAYEILIFVLTYLMLRGFFEHQGGAGFGGWSTVYAMFAAAVLALMFVGFIRNFIPGTNNVAGSGERIPEGAEKYLRAAGWISFIIIWELIIAGLFLPLDFLYQGASVFIIIAGLMDLIALYIFGELSRTKALGASMIVFTFLVFVFTSARWVL